jgi:hypothetical protein
MLVLIDMIFTRSHVSLFIFAVFGAIGTVKSQSPKRDFGAVRHLSFQEVVTPPEPDYAVETSWMALPWRKDMGDSTTPNIQMHAPLVPSDQADVFWIHPTTYIDASMAPYHWNAPVPNRYLDSLTDAGPMLYQASVFNGAGRLFAPKYRQAHLYAFYTPSAKDGKAALDTAYADVKKAFLYYLNHWNQGRPFIIASHSQGSYHGGRLVAEFMDRGPLRGQLIAAYLPGMPIPKDTFPQLPICASPEQTGCVISWSTYARHYRPEGVNWEHTVAVNPLSWDTISRNVPARENPGGMLWKFGKIHPKLNNAELVGGILWIKKPRFFGNFLFHWKNYHIADYNLFYVSIRKNAALRTNTYLRGLVKTP